MKIVIFSQMLTGGGAERVASMWIKGFVEQGYSVVLVMSTCNPNPITYPLSPKVKVYNMHDNNRLRILRNKICHRLGLIAPVPLALKKIIDTEKPNVVIGLLHPYATWMFKTFGHQIPIIHTEHNSFERPESAPMSRRSRIDKFILNKNFQYVTVLTHRDYDIASKYLKNVSVLPNPLAFKPIESIPKKEKILFVSARLDVWHCKGLDVLIKAWGKIAWNHSEWKLKIAGTDDTKAKKFLIEISKQANIASNQIEFLGFQKDILSLYKKSHIFVLSSRYEGFGMSLIEAMSQGCACIACDFKGRQREIIQDDSQGIICPIEDIDALANAMEKMISDEAYRKVCQKNAIERSKYYALPNIMERWNEIFKKLNLIQ